MKRTFNAISNVFTKSKKRKIDENQENIIQKKQSWSSFRKLIITPRRTRKSFISRKPRMNRGTEVENFSASAKKHYVKRKTPEGKVEWVERFATMNIVSPFSPLREISGINNSSSKTNAFLSVRTPPTKLFDDTYKTPTKRLVFEDEVDSTKETQKDENVNMSPSKVKTPKSNFKFRGTKFNMMIQSRLDLFEKRLEEAKQYIEDDLQRYQQEQMENSKKESSPQINKNVFLNIVQEEDDEDSSLDSSMEDASMEDSIPSFENSVQQDTFSSLLNKKTINLSTQNISNTTLQKLCEALKTNTIVNELNLSLNSLDCISAAYIADMLRHNKCIKILNLENNFIRDRGVSMLLDALEVNYSIVELHYDSRFICEEFQDKIDLILNRNRNAAIEDDDLWIRQ